MRELLGWHAYKVEWVRCSEPIGFQEALKDIRVRIGERDISDEEMQEWLRIEWQEEVEELGLEITEFWVFVTESRDMSPDLDLVKDWSDLISLMESYYLGTGNWVGVYGNRR